MSSLENQRASIGASGQGKANPCSWRPLGRMTQAFHRSAFPLRLQMTLLLSALLPDRARKFMRGVERVCYRLVGTAKLKSAPITLEDPELLSSFVGFQSLPELVAHIRNRTSPSLFLVQNMGYEIPELFQGDLRPSLSGIVNQADLICLHTFDVLGSGPAKVEKDGSIDWHLDFKNGRSWPLVHYKGIDTEELGVSSDIKVPWELSRSQHFVLLGQAYLLTKDEKYAREFVDELSSWMVANPVGLGVNWVSTMDVAIRAVNWLLGFEFFKNSSSLSDEFVSTFLKWLLLHARHIGDNLERSRVTTNHYLSNVAGLLYIWSMFPEAKESASWKAFAIGELRAEMTKQVREGGMDFEGSTCYHRLALELFFFPTLLSVANCPDFSGDFRATAVDMFGSDYVDRLYRMFEFVSHTVKPNGMMPQIGDNDSGRLHVFSKKEILDMRYLLDLGSIFFEEPRFRIEDFKVSEDTIWTFGKDRYRRLVKSRGCFVRDIRSKAFEDSGIYVMRDDDIYLIIHCSTNGQAGVGGHNHNDVLSFELNVAGKDVIVDPGTFAYTSDYRTRNKYRSSAVHNSVTVDEQEPNRFEETRLFKMYNDAAPKMLHWEMNDGEWIFEGEHYGYCRLRRPVVHRRMIAYSRQNRKIVVRDRFDGYGLHVFDWNLTFAPGVERITAPVSGVLCWTEEEACYSPGYGIAQKTRGLKARVEATVPFEAEFEFPIQHAQERRLFP